MNIRKRMASSHNLAVVFVLIVICILSSAQSVRAAETMSDEEKKSAYGFFVWLSENEELSVADRTDAAIAAQLLKGEVSSEYYGQVINSGEYIVGLITPYKTILPSTVLGKEGDATSLESVREAVKYAQLGNEYRAKENLIPLNISSALMAMSEINANYQFEQWGHTRAFQSLENLAYVGGTFKTAQGTYHDPYEGWYTEEKENYDTNNGEQTGHYETLTDRNGGMKMLLTGFGFSYNNSVSGYLTSSKQFFSQHFSDKKWLYRVTDGMTSAAYMDYLNQYYCIVNGHDWDAPEYEWSDDNSNVTATRICKTDDRHVETETVRTASAVTKEPTCTEKGETTYTASFDNNGFGAQAKTLANVDAIGHKWSKPVYTWSDDNSTVTATQTCENDSSHIETETVQTTSEITKPAACEDRGETTYTASFENEAFETQIKTVDDLEPLGHDWGTPEYKWSEDNSSVTATRICKNDAEHVDPETVQTKSEITKPASCEEKGETTYTASFENDAFALQTKTVENVDALGHAWGEPAYTWSDDNGSVTATRICKNDAEHVDPETVQTKAEVTKPATCENKGETTYTASFENKAFETQSKTMENVDALGHAWGEPAYTWSDDNSSVTAIRICGNDADHVETDTVDTTSEVTKDAACEEKGETTYTASFNNEAFGTKTKTLANIDAIGHKWGEPVYEWSSDNSGVTAIRICENNGEHVDPETVKTTSEITTPATCEEKGETTYTAAFENEAFKLQTKTVKNVDALGHAWGEVTYTWSEDNSSVTATRICKTDERHVETETVNTTSEVTKPATCTEKGETTCTASFKNGAFKVQARTMENVDALGHDWEHRVEKSATCQEEGIAALYCTRCDEKQEGSEIPVPIGTHAWSDWKVVVQPTTQSEGTKERACSVCGEKETAPVEKLPEPKAEDGTAVGKGASAAAAETAILSGAGGDEGPAGSAFGLLQAKVKKAKNTSLTLTWKNIAPQYRIYGNKCGKTMRFQYIATVSGSSFTQSGLAKGTYYKYMVMAVDGSGRVVATSKALHAATSGKKVSNPKKVTVQKKVLTLKKGKSAKIKASIVNPGGKTVKKHRKLAYESADPGIAAVSKSGKVKAVQKGTTVIYVYAQNGVFAKVKIKVK